MAVTDEVPGIEATIQVDGVDLPEYDDPDPDENSNEDADEGTKGIPRVIKYIEATSGSAFAFCLIRHEQFKCRSHHIAWKAEYDGDLLEPRHETKKQGQKYWKSIVDAVVDDDQAGGYVGRDFLFGDLTIGVLETEGEAGYNPKVKHLGTLRVYVFHMKSSRSISPSTFQSVDYQSFQEEKLDEKALKGRAVTQFVQHGAPYPIQINQDREDIFDDPLERPFLVFEFRYRTKEGLMQEGVLPRPTPIDGMTDEEVRRLAFELLQKQENQQRVKSEVKQEVKQEGDIGGPGLHGSRKRSGMTGGQSSAKRYKETIRQNGAVEIDLTN